MKQLFRNYQGEPSRLLVLLEQEKGVPREKSQKLVKERDFVEILIKLILASRPPRPPNYCHGTVFPRNVLHNAVLDCVLVLQETSREHGRSRDRSFCQSIFATRSAVPSHCFQRFRLKGRGSTRFFFRLSSVQLPNQQVDFASVLSRKLYLPMRKFLLISCYVIFYIKPSLIVGCVTFFKQSITIVTAIVNGVICRVSVWSLKHVNDSQCDFNRAMSRFFDYRGASVNQQSLSVYRSSGTKLEEKCLIILSCDLLYRQLTFRRQRLDRFCFMHVFYVYYIMKLYLHREYSNSFVTIIQKFTKSRA